MTLSFTPPLESTRSAVHHARAAAKNTAVAEVAIGQLRDALSGSTDLERILLKAAAGAGKSYVLKKLVADAIEHQRCLRVAVIAFQNRQLWPIAAGLGKTVGKDKVCLFAAKGVYDDVPKAVFEVVEVNTTTSTIPDDCVVIIATSHKLGAMGEHKRLLDKFGAGANGVEVLRRAGLARISRKGCRSLTGKL